MDTATERDLLYGIPAIAEYLGLRKSQAKHRCHIGDIPTFKIGGTVCARRSSLTAWMSEQENKDKAKIIAPNQVKKADGDQKSRGGASQVYPWEAAYDRLFVIVGKKTGLPESSAKLAEMYRQEIVKEGYVDADIDYIKQRLRKKHPILWDACLQSPPPSVAGAGGGK